MRAQYRITWRFVGGRTLMRLVHFDGDGAAVRAARAPEFYRSIFRRAGLVARTASEYEYTDRFPAPEYVHVERVGS